MIILISIYGFAIFKKHFMVYTCTYVFVVVLFIYFFVLFCFIFALHGTDTKLPLFKIDHLPYSSMLFKVQNYVMDR